MFFRATCHIEGMGKMYMTLPKDLKNPYTYGFATDSTRAMIDTNYAHLLECVELFREYHPNHRLGNFVIEEAVGAESTWAPTTLVETVKNLTKL